MITALAGTSFNKVDFQIIRGDAVVVVREHTSPFDNDSHPAYAVHYMERSGARIGYIPTIETNKNKMIEARQKNDLNGFEYNREKCNSLEYLRDCLYTDMTRNEIENPVGKVYSVKWKGDNGWTAEPTDGPVSITVVFDYE